MEFLIFHQGFYYSILISSLFVKAFKTSNYSLACIFSKYFVINVNWLSFHLLTMIFYLIFVQITCFLNTRISVKNSDLSEDSYSHLRNLLELYLFSF